MSSRGSNRTKLESELRTALCIAGFEPTSDISYTCFRIQVVPGIRSTIAKALPVGRYKTVESFLDVVFASIPDSSDPIAFDRVEVKWDSRRLELPFNDVKLLATRARLRAQVENGIERAGLVGEDVRFTHYRADFEGGIMYSKTLLNPDVDDIDQFLDTVIEDCGLKSDPKLVETDSDDSENFWLDTVGVSWNGRRFELYVLTTGIEDGDDDDVDDDDGVKSDSDGEGGDGEGSDAGTESRSRRL